MVAGFPGESVVLLVHDYAITIHYWLVSPSTPQQRILVTNIRVLELQRHCFFLFKWWHKIVDRWFCSFCFYYSQTITMTSVCPISLAPAITTLSEEAELVHLTSSSGIQILIYALFKMTQKWYSSQDQDSPFWGLFQPRERYARADTKNKKAKPEKTNNLTVKRWPLQFTWETAPTPHCTARQAVVLSSCSSWPQNKGTLGHMSTA